MICYDDLIGFLIGKKAIFNMLDKIVQDIGNISKVLLHCFFVQDKMLNCYLILACSLL